MKLKKEYENYESIYKQGYTFDPDTETFYTDKKDFELPEGFKNWTVEKVDFSLYLKERLDTIGAKKEDIEIELSMPDSGEKYTTDIFTINKRGDIEILQYSLYGVPHTYQEKSATHTTTPNREHFHVQKRHHPLHEHIANGKCDFSEAKNAPFWPPWMLKLYAEKTKVHTLYITEGQIKAFKGCLEQIPVVGLTSITHYQTGDRMKRLHVEIIDFIQTCQVENIVVLWDGDCLEISSKDLDAKRDVTKRPKLFKNSAVKIKQQIEDTLNSSLKVKVFFAMINSEDYDSKGLDDLLVDHPKKVKEVREEMLSIGQSMGRYIRSISINGANGEKALTRFFQMESYTKFYEFHKEKIGRKEFVYFGSTYQINERGHVQIKVDANIKRYKRIGTDWYKEIDYPVADKEGNTVGFESRLTPWKKETIVQDHGKDMIKYIQKYSGFINRANHVNYQQICDGMWNLYSPLKHEPKQGEFPNISKFLKHIFEEHFDNHMCYDYFSVLYNYPYEKLPVLCLVSKEEGTGKSTFIDLLKMIFGSNMAKITSEDLLGQWTSHWVDKLIAASEETFLEKSQALERIKYLSTATSIQRAERFVQSQEIDCMLKFVFCSNHEENFIKLPESSSRFWIRKIKKIEGEKDPEFLMKMHAEIPAFIHFISTREIVNPKLDRMWFTPQQMWTRAFQKIVAKSEPGIVKDLKDKIEQLFLWGGAEKIEMTLDDIRTHFKVRDSIGDAYLRNDILKGYLSLEYKRKYPTTYSYSIPSPSDSTKVEPRKGKGNAFVMHRADFVTADPTVKNDTPSNQVSMLDQIPNEE